MGLKLCVLGSGSSGNSTYVASDTTAILIDAGLSRRETQRRLAGIGVELSDIGAICVTHEHSDHVSSLGTLHARDSIMLYANTGTIEAISSGRNGNDLRWNMFTTGSLFRIGDLEIYPFAVSHDSYEPVGFVISHGGISIGIATDMGSVGEAVKERLKGCRVLVLEANHDEDTLFASDRPMRLKQRIASRQGHLSNRQAAELIAGIAGHGAETVFLAHLSSECNIGGTALKTVKKALSDAGCEEVRVMLTYQDRPSECVEIEKG